MHELAVAQAIVAAAERHAEGQPVSVVRVRVGRLRQVVPEYLSFYFEVASKKTLCQGASLEWERVDSRLACSDCGEQWDPAPPPAREQTSWSSASAAPPVAPLITAWSAGTSWWSSRLT